MIWLILRGGEKNVKGVEVEGDGSFSGNRGWAWSGIKGELVLSGPKTVPKQPCALTLYGRAFGAHFVILPIIMWVCVYSTLIIFLYQSNTIPSSTFYFFLLYHITSWIILKFLYFTNFSFLLLIEWKCF